MQITNYGTRGVGGGGVRDGLKKKSDEIKK